MDKNLTHIINLFSENDDFIMDRDIRQWREQICNGTLLFFTVFALFSYVPSMYLAIQENYSHLAVAASILYGSYILLFCFRKIDYRIRASIGLFLFYLQGTMLLIVLGPSGAGIIWMFSTTVLAAFLLGNGGAVAAFSVYALSNFLIWVLLKHNMLHWPRFSVSPEVWLIKSANNILMNLSIVVANALFVNGFNHLIGRIVQNRNASMIGLAKLAEYRDNETGQHLIRLQRYIELLSQDLKKTAQYKAYITHQYIRDLKNSIILHDIGKVGIPDSILLKPGKLEDSEYAIIKEHPRIGGDVIAAIENNTPGRSLYCLAKEIALYHHERWDGTGYPEGLKEEGIPLSARITALLDVYDALVSKRPYKLPMKHEKAIEIIRSQKGLQFDPDIVASFLRVSDQIKEIHQNLSDDLRQAK